MQRKRRTRRLDRRTVDRQTLPSNGDHSHPLTDDAVIRDRVAQFKSALAYLSMTSRRAALDARVAETRFSDIMRGRVQPTPKEQTRIAKVLKRSKETLFGKAASLIALSYFLAGLTE